jgi:hypothetical protein
MALPRQPITLTVEQIAEFNRRLSQMRHDINNHLAMITAAMELIRLKPEECTRFLGMMADQPTKIKEEVDGFSSEFDRVFGIVRKKPTSDAGWAPTA